eukprot:Anaeramoba_ignava/a218952_9.p1 GENE.a218952_9~~a218952_9.p1  ORF type:complete len:127 (-),score=42.91 a218952_9:11-391(-)
MQKSRLARRNEQFSSAIKQIPIDMSLIKALAFTGIPDSSNLRPIFWKILLNYLPLNPKEWEDTLKENRENFHILKKEVMIFPFDLSFNIVNLISEIEDAMEEVKDSKLNQEENEKKKKMRKFLFFF